MIIIRDGLDAGLSGHTQHARARAVAGDHLLDLLGGQPSLFLAGCLEVGWPASIRVIDDGSRFAPGRMRSS